MQESGTQPAHDELTRRVLELLARGSKREALEALMTLEARVYAVCLQFMRREDLAQDALQETFKSAWTSLESFGGRSQVSSWLIGIARHRCCDLLRRMKPDAAAVPIELEYHDPADPRPGPDTGPDEVGLAQVVRRCIAKLPQAIRLAVLLRFSHDVSYVEMETITGVRAPTLQARVARALPGLRRCLEAHGVRP